LYFGSRFYFKAGWVSPENMDFVSGIKEIEAACYDEPPAKNKLEAAWKWLVSAFSYCLDVQHLMCYFADVKIESDAVI
jgi:hypothetical protein